MLTDDFNLPQINWSNNTVGGNGQGKVLIDLLNDSFLTQLVQTPTRTAIKTGKGNILDLVLSSHPDCVDKPVVGEVLSDHCILTFTILEAPRLLETKITQNLHVQQRQLRRYEKGHFLFFLSVSSKFSRPCFTKPELDQDPRRVTKIFGDSHSKQDSIAKEVQTRLDYAEGQTANKTSRSALQNSFKETNS